MPGNHSFPLKYFVLTLVVSALVSSSFGFFAGYVAGNSPAAERLLAGFAGVSARSGVPPLLPRPAARPIQQPTQEDLTIAAVKKASPAVISIVISKEVPTYEQYNATPFGNDQFFQQFFGQGFQVPRYRQKGTEKKEVGAGSGFIVSADGYIVTNKHVVADAQAEYTVVLQDGRKLPGKVLARDPSNDIAVVKIAGKGFPTLALGDANALQVGQSVIAIGYALGQFGNTVSTGVVSGLSRSIVAGGGADGAENLSGVIQTDAAINPGNSGGPLLDLRGTVVGVDVAIVQGSQNIGFALPINDIKKVVDGVRKTGKITRPFLGVRYVLINAEMQKANQLSVEYGALVSRGTQPTDLAVLPGSPADIAGIVENDIILEVGGKKITQEYSLEAAIREYGVGEKIKMKVLHKGETKTVEITLAEKK